MKKTTLKIIKVTDKGQITIPREIQTLLEIRKGDRLILATKDKKLLIQKASNLEKKIDDDFKDLLKLSEKTAKNLWDNKYDETWNKV